MERGKILDEAKSVINGERQDTYGNPEDSFALIAAYWDAYLQSRGWTRAEYTGLDALDAMHMLMLFKVARMSGQGFSLDNYRDLAGYTGLAADQAQVVVTKDKNDA